MMRVSSTVFPVRFLLAVLLLLVAARVHAECDECQYDGTDATDCKVYGQLGDDKLIAWTRASQDCLDAHNIKVEAVNPTMLSSMFPNADGTGGNINAFVSFLKNTGGAAVNAILVSMDEFFVEPPAGQKPSFKDSIMVDGKPYNCATSESDCWNALKVYFATPEGKTVMESVGKDLYAKAKVGKELEQSTVRIAICNDYDEDGELGASFDCGSLATQVVNVKKENPDKACSAFGLGPAENAIPGCENFSSSSRGASTSSAASWSFGSTMMMSTIFLMLAPLALWSC